MPISVRRDTDLLAPSEISRRLAVIEEKRIRDLVTKDLWEAELSYPEEEMSDVSFESDSPPPGLLTEPPSPENLQYSQSSPVYNGFTPPRIWEPTRAPPWGMDYANAPPETPEPPDDPDDPGSGESSWEMEYEEDDWSDMDLPQPVPAAAPETVDIEVINITSSPEDFSYSPEYRYTSPSYSPNPPSLRGSPDSDGYLFKPVKVFTPIRMLADYFSEESSDEESQ